MQTPGDVTRSALSPSIPYILTKRFRPGEGPAKSSNGKRHSELEIRHFRWFRLAKTPTASSLPCGWAERLRSRDLPCSRSSESMSGYTAWTSGFGRTGSRGSCVKWRATAGQRSDAGDGLDPRGTITVHIPLTFRKRGGRKLAMTPDGTAWARWPWVNNAIVKALARAFRWRRMLDAGEHATLEDLARAKGVAPFCVSQMLRPTLLAPEIVEAILDERQPAGLQLDDLLEEFPLEWSRQRSTWGWAQPSSTLAKQRGTSL
jgi:hypothetical protein